MVILSLRSKIYLRDYARFSLDEMDDFKDELFDRLFICVHSEIVDSKENLMEL